MKKILTLNGPNLNLLGLREPGHYGQKTLDEINHQLMNLATAQGVALECFQHNSECKLIDRIHSAFAEKIDFIIFNPAAYTHTSIALRDAILGVKIPFIELHLSNIYKRETFRHHSYFSDISTGVICGLGSFGYEVALLAAIKNLEDKD